MASLVSHWLVGSCRGANKRRHVVLSQETIPQATVETRPRFRFVSQVANSVMLESGRYQAFSGCNRSFAVVLPVLKLIYTSSLLSFFRSFNIVEREIQVELMI